MSRFTFPSLKDKEYMQLLEGHLPWIVDTFRPDLVLYDAGVDPHVKDELGKLCLTDQGVNFIFVYLTCFHQYWKDFLVWKLSFYE